MTTYDDVLVRRHPPDDTVVEIVLDRPRARNALSTAMARGGRGHTHTGERPGAARRRIVVSTEQAFSVGADLKERHAFSDADLMRQRLHYRAAFGGVLDLPVPTIAAVAGYALGGGFELALSCDLIVADETSVVGLPEVTVGVIPGGGGTQLLSRRVGASRAADLIFTGRRVTIDEADRLGLVDRRVPAGSARAAALDLAGLIAANSPIGVRNAKRALRQGAGTDLATALEVEDGAWRATASRPIDGRASPPSTRSADPSGPASSTPDHGFMGSS